MLKKEMWVLITNLLIVSIFSFIYISRKNYEFLIYISVVIAILFLVLTTQKKIKFPSFVLWGLTLWNFFHMAGGSFFFSGKRLYDIILIELSTTYPIFRYDQFVHIFGFGVSTLAMFYLVKPAFSSFKRRISISIVVIMAGLGVGALNEIIEFIITVVNPNSGIGGYVNNSLDLVADFIGAIFAWVIIYFRDMKS